jgi:biotin transporter BioY
MEFSQKKDLVLSQAIWPATGLWRDLILVLGGSWLVALLAQLEIGIGPVPVTGQTLGVLLVGALLGSRLGAASMIAYLVQGAMGLPFFAGGAAGAAYLVGATAGYLAGFVVAAFVVGWLAERGWDRRMGTAVLAMLIGNVIIYAFGLAWLSRFTGLEAVLSAGLIPFIPGDIIKIIIAAGLLPLGWKILGK